MVKRAALQDRVLPAFVPLPMPSRPQDLPEWNARQWRSLAQHLDAVNEVLADLIAQLPGR